MHGFKISNFVSYFKVNTSNGADQPLKIVARVQRRVKSRALKALYALCTLTVQ